MAIKSPIGDFKFGIGDFRIEIWELMIQSYGKINICNTPIPNSKSPIGYVIANW